MCPRPFGGVASLTSGIKILLESRDSKQGRRKYSRIPTAWPAPCLFIFTVNRKGVDHDENDSSLTVQSDLVSPDRDRPGVHVRPVRDGHLDWRAVAVRDLSSPAVARFRPTRVFGPD